MRRHLEEQETLEPTEVLRSDAGLLHVNAKRLDQLAVLHAGRAGRLARPAIQAQIEMAFHLRIQLHPAIDHRSHQIDAAARTVVLIAQLHVGRTCGGAQAAMDAVEKQLVIDTGVVRCRDSCLFDHTTANSPTRHVPCPLAIVWGNAISWLIKG